VCVCVYMCVYMCVLHVYCLLCVCVCVCCACISCPLYVSVNVCGSRSQRVDHKDSESTKYLKKKIRLCP
jgi:hypothetical protein